MRRPDLLAYLLIGTGVLALLGRWTDGAGWLWMALVAAALLGAYVSQRTYGFLVLGGVLAGSAVGLLLQAAFPACDGVFLISLGFGLFAVDRVERRENRWPRLVGVALVAIGTVSGVVSSGVLRSTWFALVLIAVGALVLWRVAAEAAVALRPPAVRREPADPTRSHPCRRDARPRPARVTLDSVQRASSGRVRVPYRQTLSPGPVPVTSPWRRPRTLGGAMEETIYRGLNGVNVDTSEICFIDGEAGELIYRGYDIRELKDASYEEVVYLLWEGELPTAAQLEAFRADLAARVALPPVELELLGSCPPTPPPCTTCAPPCRRWRTRIRTPTASTWPTCAGSVCRSWRASPPSSPRSNGCGAASNR